MFTNWGILFWNGNISTRDLFSANNLHTYNFEFLENKENIESKIIKVEFSNYNSMKLISNLAIFIFEFFC